MNSKIAIITLRSRQELIGKDERFKIKTDTFDGSYTNTLQAGLGKALIVQEDCDTGDFVLPALDTKVTEIRIHKSWVSTVDYPVQTADDLLELIDDPQA